MDFLVILSLIIFGLLAGILGGFLGTGGCVIMLPALYFLYGYSLPLAIGTTITAVIITATSGSIAHIRIRNVDYRTTIIVTISGGIGAAIGSIIFQYLTAELPLLKVIIGLAFLYVSIRMIYEGLLRGGRIEKTGNMVPGTILAKNIDRSRNRGPHWNNWIRGRIRISSILHLPPRVTGKNSCRNITDIIHKHGDSIRWIQDILGTSRYSGRTLTWSGNSCRSTDRGETSTKSPSVVD